MSEHENLEPIHEHTYRPHTGVQEQLTAAREERSQYADYGDAAAALDRVGRA